MTPNYLTDCAPAATSRRSERLALAWLVVRSLLLAALIASVTR